MINFQFSPEKPPVEKGFSPFVLIAFDVIASLASSASLTSSAIQPKLHSSPPNTPK